MISQVPLKEVLTFHRGLTFKPEDLVEVGSPNSIVCFRTKNIQEELDEHDLIAIPDKIMKRGELEVLTGDILISTANSWGLVGKCVRVLGTKYRSTLGGFISLLRPNHAVVDPDYLYRFLTMESTQHAIRHLGKQTTNISNLDRVRFLEIEIPLPPLEIQKKIADILEKADHLRKDCQQMEQELSNLAQSVFMDMFGDPVENPKGWGKYPLKSVTLEFKYGTSEKSSDEGDPILRIPNVVGDQISLEDIKYISLNEKEKQRLLLKYGDLLFVRTNGNRDYIGRSCVFELNGDYVYASYLIRARIDQSRVNPFFLNELFKLKNGRKLITDNAKTTAGQFNLNTQGLGAASIIVPPIELQSKYVAMLKVVWAKVGELKLQKNEYDALFESLMQKAFSGELCFSEHAA